jgi:arylsulfatase A-like enzyme
MYDPAKLILRGNVAAEAEEKTRKTLAGYYAHCTALDECVGELMKTLENEGLSSNTIVIFSSDHGDMLGSHGFNAKQKPWDESVRVPLLIRWPKQLPAQRNYSVFTSEDFAPTLLGLCGAPIPKTVEGRDLSQHLRDGAPPRDNFGVIACIVPFGEWDYRRGGKEFRGLRTERYTYVRDLNGPWLLFDNQSDPLQQTNQVNQAKVQAELDQRLKAVLKARGDTFEPGSVYVNKWGYQTNATGTVPYTE